MVKMLDLVPKDVVMMSGSEEMVSPCKDQAIVKGSSPVTTEQIICANVPSLTVSEGDSKLAINGGSA